MNNLAIALSTTLTLSFLPGCSILNAGGLKQEGLEFVSRSVETQKTKWDAAKLVQNLDPNNKASSKDVDDVIRTYIQALGPIKAMDSLNCLDYKFNVGINMPDCVGAYQATLTCEKAKAKVNIIAIHRDGKWFVSSFNVDSEAFNKFGNKNDRAEAQKFVDTIAPEFCDGFTYEMLRKYADSQLLQELEKNSMAAKATFAVSNKALGRLKGYCGSQFSNWSMNNGQPLYVYVAVGEFERGKAQMRFVVVKESAKWKLCRFDIQSGGA